MALDPVPPPAAGAVVRPLRPDDLPEAARLHAAALPEGFFSRLGPRFVARYLESYLDGPVAVALAAEVDGRQVGHLAGTVGPGHYAWALRHRWRRLLPYAALALVTRPSLLVPLLRTRVGRYTRALRRVAHGAGDVAERAADQAVLGVPAALLHIAVEPDARGTGAGAALVRAFEERARAAGCRSARLVAFAGDPADPSSGAGPFYERLGWLRTGERVDDSGRQVLVYSRAL